jgi:hypothetical protein
VRQQSIAVLPTPMISTRSPIESCAEGDRLEPVDADVDAVRIVAAGHLEFLPRGAPLPTKTASKPFVEQRFMLSTGEL